MQRFESLTPQDIANIINTRTNTTLLISKEIAQTEDEPVGYVPMGMPYLPDEAVKQIIAQSSINGNDVITRWQTFIIITSYVGGAIKFVNLEGDDCEITVDYPVAKLPPIKFT